MATIANLMNRLLPDDWRADVEFSPDIEQAQRVMFSSGDENIISEELSRWLGKYQPCFFGRYAAKKDLISYCVLTERDLASSDDEIADKIRNTRNEWTRRTWRAEKSGFIILAVSERLARSIPDDNVAMLAQRLASLYLLTETEFNRIHHDEVFLQIPDYDQTSFKWLAGVNYFCSHGDKRWWHDHRIPGGIAFSVNSVGHMVKSGALKNAMVELYEEIGLSREEAHRTQIDSRKDALQLAMQTIANAAPTDWGPATELIETSELSPTVTCPVELPKHLRSKNHCEYRGYYHTDETLPSLYFRQDVGRPADAPATPLDFTYLFHTHVDNPENLTMFEGRQVRAIDDSATAMKIDVAEPQVVKNSEEARLREALSQ